MEDELCTNALFL
jgi:hypothetical protein